MSYSTSHEQGKGQLSAQNRDGEGNQGVRGKEGDWIARLTSSLIFFQMILVISSPSSSTTAPLTLIFSPEKAEEAKEKSEEVSLERRKLASGEGKTSSTDSRAGSRRHLVLIGRESI